MGKRGSMEIELSEEIVAVLGEMAMKSGSKSIFEKLKRSVELRRFLLAKIDEGNAIKLIDPERPSDVTVVVYS